jgi:uncharacterized membrane protein (UPF0127 family)
MVKVNFNYKNKKINLEAKKCEGLMKGIGLMFSSKEKTDILVFEFKDLGKHAIHSFFCSRFVAVWLDEKNKVVDLKIVSPWRLSVRPKKDFRKLIEIPINKKNKRIINFLVGK